MSEQNNYGDVCPIAAFATALGKSALTLIRCSGKDATEAVASIFSAPEKLKQAAGHTIVHGWILSTNTNAAAELIDEVLISVFRAPKSYTGEDSLDISCHGGPAVGQAVMRILKSAGFREALPGEFTFRAFMNGKLDLTKAESVMELVSVKTDNSRRNAVGRLFGALENEINEIKKMLVHLLASAEIYLDYSEDEISADSPDEIAGRLPKRDIALAALARLKKLAASWQIQRIYQQGITVVIAGQPNAGKSCLFNQLLKEDRSIVTNTPGTTRDWIEAWVSIEGIPVRLIDTAGLRESKDPIEKIGIERTRQLLKKAELVIYLIDGAQGITEEDIGNIKHGLTRINADYDERDLKNPCKSESFNNNISLKYANNYILIWNKSDLVPPPSQSEDFISVSAKTGEGLAELHAAIVSIIMNQMPETAASQLTTHNATLGSERQKNLVCTAITALEEALALADREQPLDIIAPLLREAVNALGEITGEVSTADILEEMFSKFCVGK